MTDSDRYAHLAEIMPQVGFGATLHLGSAAYAGTVTAISPTGVHLLWRRDIAVPDPEGDPFAEVQSYEFEQNSLAKKIRFSRRADGVFRRVGGDSTAVLITGIREEIPAPPGARELHV